jgi:hypothetical protein
MQRAVSELAGTGASGHGIGSKFGCALCQPIAPDGTRLLGASSMSFTVAVQLV